MKESIINTLYDNWCNSEFEPEVKEVMDSAIKNPTEDTIFELSSVVSNVEREVPVRCSLKDARKIFNGKIRRIA